MIIKCENKKCGATYNLDISHVKTGDVRVRCSICKHEFRVSPFPHAGAKGHADPSMPFSDMKTIGKWLGLAAAALMVVAALVAVFVFLGK